MLPSTTRVEAIPSKSFKKIWVYGQPFSGKTTFADQAPTPLNLNTDGNVKYVTMPRLAIKDIVTVEGSQGRERSNKTFAWAIFKDAIDDLERGSQFETIVVDLVEDTYEQCRLYMYDKLGIEHESDDAFRAWDKVRIEFLSTYRRLLNLDYNIILISHEDTSKDITKKGGDKITAIKPNITDKIANKLAGMVDIVARAVAETDDYRVLTFKQDEVTFGGGRLKGLTVKEVPLKWDELMKVYDGLEIGTPVPAQEPTTSVKEAPTEVKEEVKAEEKPVRRARAARSEEPTEAAPVEEPKEEVSAAPVRRQRRVR